MNISNSSHYSLFNGTEADFNMSSVSFILSVLMSFPLNSYVIWLIVTGTGNGLGAEFFILNLSVCDIIQCVENLLIFFLYIFKFSWIVVAVLDGVLIIGHPVFQCLICVERYLAVVHPVIFLKFKPLRYKVMCSAVVWMATFASGGFNSIIYLFCFEVYYIFCLVPFLVFLSIQLFCCVAVLRVLKQSGPGERGREREEENHMKKRAFYLILITTVTMVIIYITFITLVFYPTEHNELKLSIGQFCFTLAGLVQPVLFLYRVGKLNFIKCQ